ncbi:MAG: transglycosylase SLT domain-containing protein, partial [Saprospiraceae bacterium]|nr:transglycosylase SLT domain-containing protein [Saprospiraceae bacterium]
MSSQTRTLLIINALLSVCLIAFFMCSFKGEDGKAPDQRVRSINLDKNFTFCGEKFPMDNWDVRQRLDAELLRNVYFHSQTILAVKRANAIFPIIEPILKEEGVPADLKYLAVAESALSNAISPAGARGVWQFMKDAAAGYNLEVNTEVDER